MEKKEKMKTEKTLTEQIKRQKNTEESMVKTVEALEKKVHNHAARLLLAELRLDSIKHASVCKEMLDVIEKTKPERLWDARIESYVDMQAVKKELERHIKLEEEMLKDTERVIAASKDEALKLLLTHIAEDEKKHHKNIKLIIDRSYAMEP